MGIVIRQSIKSSVVSYLGVIIGTANLLWLSARFLSTEQIALTRVLLGASMLFATFSQLGTTQITDRFFPHFKDDNLKHNGFFVFLLLYPFAGFLLFCLAALFFKDVLLGAYLKKAPELNDYLFYIFPLTFFVIYQNVLEAYSRIHLRIVIPTMVRELFLKPFNSFTIILYAVDTISFDTYVGLMVASYGIAVALLLFYTRWLGKLYFRTDFSKWNLPLFRQVVYFGFYIILGGLGVLLTTNIDVLMLPALSGMNSTGIYVIATFMAAVIEIPKRSISQITAPLLSQAIKKDDLAQVHELYRKTSINQLLAGMYVFLGIWCNIDAVFDLIPNGDVYRGGKYVVAFLGMSKLIDMATGANAEIIMYSRYYKFSMVTMIMLALLTVLTNYLFIPIYGLNGAAFAAALSIFIFTLLKCWFVWKKFSIHPFTMNTGYAFISAITIYLIVAIIPHHNTSAMASFISIIIRSIIITFLFLVFTIRLHISEDVNLVAQMLFKKALQQIRLFKDNRG